MDGHNARLGNSRLITFDSHIKPFVHTFVPVDIPKSMYSQITEWVRSMVKIKASEAHWVVDHGQATKRLLTGIMGEVALETYLGQKFIDWSIGPDSKEYHVPDLSSIGYNVGVKSVEYGKFPLIFKNNYYPQVINIIHYEARKCYICGLASVDVLNKYQSDELILSPALRRRGTKSGFYGFGHLTKIKQGDQHDRTN